MTSNSILACDVGGTRLRVAVVDPDGTVGSKRAMPTPGNDPDALARIMREVVHKVGRSIAGAVVGLPGPVNYLRGEVLRLPNLPDWAGHLSADSLGEELGIPVLLANDADLAALGEHRFGAGLGYRDMVYVTVSTGVGAGVILGDRLVHGELSLAEVGHTIIDRATHGTVESLGSGTALARLAGEDAASVEARARGGDSDALQYFATVAGDLAIGVFNLVHLFSPEVVVVGGGMSQAGDLLLAPIRRVLDECGADCPSSRVEVVRAKGGDDVGLRGATVFWTEYQGR